MKFRHLLLATSIAATSLIGPLSAAPTSAAIACHVNELLPTSETQIMPLIYRELPLDFVDVLRGSQPIDRASASAELATSSATPISDDESAVVSAAQNVLRCGVAQDGYAFMMNATGQLRALRVGIGNPEEGTTYFDTTSVYRVQVGAPVELEDGRWVVDFAAIIDEDELISGEMAFVVDNGEYYLDESYIAQEGELDGDTVEFSVSETFTREVKIINVVEGDRIEFVNDGTSFANLTVVDPNGDTVFNGHVMADNMVGGENQHILPIFGLAPGEYTLTATFDKDGIQMNATIVVAP